MRRLGRMLMVALIVCTGVVIAPAAQAAPGDTTWISAGLNGEQPNSGSITPDISANGRFIAFVSPATNLAPGDSWAPWGVVYNVFVHDRETGVTEKISTDPDGLWANDNSWTPSISGDGRFVAFSSAATNLVSDDDDGTHSIFIRDRLTGTTERYNATGAPQMSGDGRYVAWQGANGLTGESGIFVLDRTTGQIERVDVSSTGELADLEGASGPTISDDGRYVAFVASPHLTDPSAEPTSFVYLRDRLTGTTEIVSLGSDGIPVLLGTDRSGVSGDGRYVVFTALDGTTPGDTNDVTDVFVRDRLLGTTERASVASDGTQSDMDCWAPEISADGRFVAFMSSGTTLVPGDTNATRDAFVHDRLHGTTTRVTVSSDGSEANDMVASIAISGDGRFVAFESHATNLTDVPDMNTAPDVYLHEIDPARLAPPAYVPAFDRTRARIDQLVGEGLVARTWIWGPGGNTDPIQEPYAEAVNGRRVVQYFDKTRMELTYPALADSSPWAVTTGLLVVELVSGQLQVGDDVFATRAPAPVNIAGDPDDPAGPTYATFGTLLDQPPLADDQVITQVVDRAGNVTNDPRLARWDVRSGAFIPETNHRVANVFWDFLHSSGVVCGPDGSMPTERLFDPWYYASGLPISEAYWTTVQVGGTPREVLVQAFERRVLTYTPDNPEGWQVEAGNVGQHYYWWRYTEIPDNPIGQIAFISERDGNPELYVMRADGLNPRRITDDLEPEMEPVWSPDGSRIAFVSIDKGHANIYVVNPDGTGLRQLTFLGGESSGFSWSPDGSQIVFTHQTDDQQRQLYIVNADGTGLRQLTPDGLLPDWSPDAEWIVYATYRDGTWPLPALWLIRPDGTGAHRLVVQGSGPVWSPDGTRIAYLHVDEGQTDIYTVRGDGNDARKLTDSPADDDAAIWSPDGTSLMVESAGFGGLHVYVVTADGVLSTRVSGTYEINTIADWSPNGNWVLYSALRDRASGLPEYDLVVSTPDGRYSWLLTDSPGFDGDASWAP